VQHRGGAPGFVRALDAQTLAWADFAGNRQYISIGNAAANAKVAMIFVDYAARQRLKVLGRLTAFEAAERQDLRAQLEIAGYPGRIEHVVLVRIEAFDWNCPQHITRRFTAAEVDLVTVKLRNEIVDLQRRLASR
jgi:predicted pyridoxine 5'-phosphate oxidase superfamily flavin-nucleotide-binding protein